MPPPAKAQEALRKQKDARQKKLLFALAPLLVALLAWQGPGTFKALTGGDAPPPDAVAVPASTTGPTPATTADPTSAAPSTAAPPAATTPAPAPAEAGDGTLPESDEPTEAGPGQLVTFDRFVGRDPFQQGVEIEPESAGSDGGDPAAGDDPTVSPAPSDPFAGPPPADGGGDGDGSTPPSSTAPETAVVDVNGVRETLRVDASFPASDPVFTLVSISKKNIKVGLVTGEFSTGVRTVTVKLGKTVTLVSEPDGLRYIITLISVK